MKQLRFPLLTSPSPSPPLPGLHLTEPKGNIQLLILIPLDTSLRFAALSALVVVGRSMVGGGLERYVRRRWKKEAITMAS